jgi:ornithine cyclodeaminase
MSVEFLYLSQEDVVKAGILNMKLAVSAVEESFKLHGEGKTILPTKVVLDLNERERGRINALPAYVGDEINVCGLKWIAGFPQNPNKHGLPRASGLMILNDAETGVPIAIMDGTLLSAMRTGAVSGVAAKYLARENSKVAALIGTGVQARTQLMALKEVCSRLEKVYVYSRTKEKRELFANSMKNFLNINIEAVDSAEVAVKDADIVITATTADEPIVKNAWIKKGSLFIHIGSYVEEEYDVVLNSDKIIVDDWEQVKHRKTPTLARMYDSGLIKDKDIYAELGEIVAGKKPGREYNEERIYCLPIGLGIHDVVLAYKIYRNAIKLKLGVRLKLWKKFTFTNFSS